MLAKQHQDIDFKPIALSNQSITIGHTRIKEAASHFGAEKPTCMRLLNSWQ
jgi:hypothetical protein